MITKVVLNSDEEVMEYLETHPNEIYTIYTVGEEGTDLNYAMVGYTRDGKMTFGLSCEDSEPELAAKYFRELKAFTGTSDGYCGVEVAPPESAEEYEQSVSAFDEAEFFAEDG